MEWQTKGAGRKIQKTLNPETNMSERAAMDQALQMYRMGVSKGKQTAKGAGKGQPHGGKNGWGKGKSEPPKWTCSFCFDKNVSHHSWCNAVGCGMHYLDAAHLTEEAMTGSKQAKGKGKGKDKGKGRGMQWCKRGQFCEKHLAGMCRFANDQEMPQPRYPSVEMVGPNLGTTDA